MEQQKHWAIDGSNFSMESNFIKQMLKGEGKAPLTFLKNKKGLLFSKSTLTNFIKEEVQHNIFTLTNKNERSITTYSSGEQKKALLSYLLSKNPDFLILDNPFDLLDQAFQKELLLKLKELSKHITFIQIFKRVDTVLPFINNVLQFKEESIVFTGTLNAYKAQIKVEQNFKLNKTIPPAINIFKITKNPLIEFKNVSVNYASKTILNNIYWQINKGDFWQLMGPNGSGKTTLLTMVTGDNPKAYGKNLILFGQKKGSGESVWEVKQKIGYITPAMTSLFNGRYTVEQMIISGFYDSIGLYKQPTIAKKKIANEWIELIGLTAHKTSWFSALSEEQKCMVLIARSMVKHPPLLILDEPTQGLSDANVSIITSLVNKIAQESETSIIYVSHQQEKGLIPKNIYKLVPTENGSIGEIILNNK
ncbi:ATP-binding cassette domain-containing protein [Lutibacter holmesii]|uniref:ATP-binding cassette domain-containing protein n=1 Tax=Lutibacter holmesii TaxID=1137985 RepID=A0ABW3WR27_9FLAO